MSVQYKMKVRALETELGKQTLPKSSQDADRQKESILQAHQITFNQHIVVDGHNLTQNDPEKVQYLSDTPSHKSVKRVQMTPIPRPSSFAPQTVPGQVRKLMKKPTK